MLASRSFELRGACDEDLFGSDGIGAEKAPAPYFDVLMRRERNFRRETHLDIIEGKHDFTST